MTNEHRRRETDKLGPYVQQVALDKANARIAELEQERDQLRQRIEAAEKQTPVKYEFKCNDGKWYGFDSDKHYSNTVDSGEFEIRALYALPPTADKE